MVAKGIYCWVDLYSQWMFIATNVANKQMNSILKSCLEGAVKLPGATGNILSPTSNCNVNPVQMGLFSMEACNSELAIFLNSEKQGKLNDCITLHTLRKLLFFVEFHIENLKTRAVKFILTKTYILFDQFK